MKKLILIITCLFYLYSYSQSKKRSSIYFLINKNDTLVYKQVATKTNSYEGYVITDETRIVTAIKRSSTLKGDDIEYDAFGSCSFSFNRENDTIVSKLYLGTLNIIKDRKRFLKVDEGMYDLSGNRYYFIEPMCNGKFILREVFPIVHE